MTDRLSQIIEKESVSPANRSVQLLCDAIKRQVPDLKAVLFYGSGLWQEAEADTVYDFYVLVDRYRDTECGWLHALLGSILAPNVYYLEVKDSHDRTYRCKYAVMRLGQFKKAVRPSALRPQIWARFSQPCRILYTAGPETHGCVIRALRQAVITFHRRAFPLVANYSAPEDVWLRGLKETYASEWRSESDKRFLSIYEASKDSFDGRTEAVLKLGAACPGYRRLLVPAAPLRRFLAKGLYFVQLVKAALTFNGGVDYALWKIKRQSGVEVKATDFQRRYPLIGAWPLLFEVVRKGGLK